MNALRPTTRLLIALGICIAFALSLLACSAPETTNTTSNTAPASNTTSTTSTTNKAATPAPAASPAASPATASGSKIGVEECDDYLAKYEACVNSKVPEAARAQSKASFEQQRKSWQQLAATPQGKAGLAAVCKAALDSAKKSMAAYGCSF